MPELRTVVRLMMKLLLDGGPAVAKELFKGLVINGAEAVSKTWQDVFFENPETYPLAHQVAQDPKDTAAADNLQTLLAQALEQLPEAVNQIQSQQQSITTGNISARGGGVSIGVAQDGAQITVYNLELNDEIIQRLSKSKGLSKKRAVNATRQLLSFFEEYFRYLPLRGMGDNSGLRLRFPLVDLFIPLNARLTLPKGDTLPPDLRIAGRKLSGEELENIGGRPDAPLPVLDLIMQYPVLVILGDPGSGKSTVLRLLAFLLATGQGQALGFGDYLPLLLPLAAYSDRLRQQPDLNLRRFAVEYFKHHVDVEDLDYLLEAKLKQGEVLILLDGLDEVKLTSQRNTVVDRVQKFLSQHIKPGNRVIMTSRIIGYKEVRPPEVAGLRECTLLDFEQDEIEGFIRRWTGTIERMAYQGEQVAAYEAERETKELLEVIRGNPAVRKLASNPLLMTMLVIQKRQGVSLPRHRVLLYEQYIVSLLHDWLLVRSLHDSPSDLPNDRALRKVLEPLAYWMQESAPGKGQVNEREMMAWLKEHFSEHVDPEESARNFVSDVRDHSGLLVDRGGNQFGFLHLTFMEYLAGVALANRFQEKDGQAQILKCIAQHANESEWRETLLLAIGYLGLKQRFDEATTAILQSLLDMPPKEKGIHHEIVGATLVDIGEDGVTPDGWRDLRAQLIADGLRSTMVPAKRRVMIGESLAEAGDPRSEVMDVDAMQFCYVPPGPFFLGSTDADEQADDDEKKGAGEHDLNYAYWLARYPVTVAQFRRYVDESGVEPGDFDSLGRPINTPVVSVSWIEAMAFCDWLTARWKGNGYLPQGYRVSLPSEPEWEKGARGGYRIPVTDKQLVGLVSELATLEAEKLLLKQNEMAQRIFPWGDAPEEDRMNFNMNIGHVSSVGAFGGGASPYGCEEMSGNVWEWTRNLFADYPYPETVEARREREGDGKGSRALRGGSFYNIQRYVRCAFRLDLVPDYRDYYVGFRVVLSPLL